jgi:hypothetical protein
MLHQPMNRTSATTIAVGLAVGAMAQLGYDRDIRFTEPASAGVSGMGSPTAPTALVSLEVSLVGAAHWAECTVLGDTLNLATVLPAGDARPGNLLRFIVPQHTHGPIHVRFAEAPTLPLLRPDGLVPALGQLEAGRIAEIVQADQCWVLLSAPERGCPVGFAAVHDRLCIEISDQANMTYFAAADRCTALGGKLCTWDEHHAACVLLQDQLQGLFDQWEWIDDHANHDHRADQVAITDCFQHQSASLTNGVGDARCCYHPR